MLDVQRYVYLLPHEIHTTNLVGFVIISLNDDRFIGEASKSCTSLGTISGCLHHILARYLCNAALFFVLVMKDFHVGMERLS